MRGCVSTIIGIVAFIGLSILAGQLLGPVPCRDGWASSSIGSRGACSWNGGVDRSRNGLGGLLMIVSGFIGFGFYNTKFAEMLDRQRKRPPPSQRTIASDQPEDAPKLAPLIAPTPRLPKPVVTPRPGAKACPKCGSAMKLRTARKGPRHGRKFWGCGRYPDCRGTIDARR
ncbi:topoisomerase DNA-binding C4 zinc finger domain-containing protein [uncultured Sphingomonas sp.]|uniref:topoisomerase DNA-binding C4 zinc finger domain-containing protein n=1 Tax=uncultured Sphingomonas sp. TaxID=158754 RepID=UPI0035CBBA90